MVSKTVNLLIVEDEAISALDMEDSLKSQGYGIVGIADTGDKAIALAKEHKPDLILMDIRLKEGPDGIETATKIWEAQKTPVIFVTSYADESILARARVVQPYGYILKPFDPQELRAVIELALDRIKNQPKLNAGTPSSSGAVEETIESIKDDSAMAAFGFLKRLLPFKELKESELIRLAKASDFKTVPANQEIESEGALSPKVFVIASGRVACVKSSASGKQLILDLVPPGDMFCLVLAMQDTPYPFAVIAQRESKIIVIDRKILQQILNENGKVYKSLFEDVSEKLAGLPEIARRLAHDRVVVRIVAALSTAVRDFGKVSHADKAFDVDMTRLELADMAGTTPETAIRVTKALERDGVLDLSIPSRIRILDFEALKKYENFPE